MIAPTPSSRYTAPVHCTVDFVHVSVNIYTFIELHIMILLYSGTLYYTLKYQELLFVSYAALRSSVEFGLVSRQ